MEDIKKKLLDRKLEIEKSLLENYKDMMNVERSADEADLEFASTIETIQASLQNNELDEYNKILNALEMIKNKTYGICIECDKEIPKKRLSIYPNSTRCIDCQQNFEQSNYKGHN